ALGRDRPEDALPEICDPAERVDELTRLEPSRDRVDGEVPAAHVVLDRGRPVGDDLEVVVTRPRAPLDPRRGQLDARRNDAANCPVRRVGAHAPETALPL